jgi:GTP-binding protein EngB required for normal cell division
LLQKEFPTDPAEATPNHTLDRLRQALDLASEIGRRYALSSLDPLLRSCRSGLAQDEIAVMIVGRFKAGKSSFINHFIGRPILPVGVIPVTTVITEIRFGSEEKAEIRFLDGSVRETHLAEIGAYISERENPENCKRAAVVKVELPELRKWQGLALVDTPGLESVLAHNTDTSMRWLPNVGLALAAISVDPPLSRRDVELLRELYRYTPNVSVLLTKADLPRPEELSEIIDFVRRELTRNFDVAVEIFPYSIRPGYEHLKERLEQILIHGTLARFDEERRSIGGRKIDTLLRESSDYLTLNLKAAELDAAKRRAVVTQIAGEKESIADVKNELRLIVRHAMAGTRAAIAGLLEKHQKEIEDKLISEFAAEFPSWTKSLGFLLTSFEAWLSRRLSAELTRVSHDERSRLVQNLDQTGRQMMRRLQEFRDRLSAGAERAFGTPLRTTEVQIAVQEPLAPDVRIGSVFDRNWELLSPVLPMALIQGLVRRHLLGLIPDIVHTNISRLTSQWEQSVNAALSSIGAEAERRFDDLIGTVERLIETADPNRAAAIREDLNAIAAASAALR